jgi:hypothetical protein
VLAACAFVTINVDKAKMTSAFMRKFAVLQYANWQADANHKRPSVMGLA